VSIEVGDTFGRWRVVRRAEAGFIGNQRRGRWVVRCTCRHTATVFGHDLRRGRSSGCSSSTGQLPERAAACRAMAERSETIDEVSTAVRQVLEAEDVDDRVIARVVEELAARKVAVGRGSGPTSGATVKA
tara:strand:+ start:649 stop:1038 length:390 start_codon:yes stop_codon:yes gene_type:complete